ncbi:MAG: peptidoglycan D,D-transpeptidase FtsI family protein [Solirubrobacterales bacterium]
MRLIERRIGLLFAGFLILLVVTFARAVWLQGVQGAELSASAQSQQSETVPVPGSRGTIRDREGRPLAVSEDAVTVFATPYQLEEPVNAAARLAPVLGMTQQQVLTKLADRSSGFAYLKRKLAASKAAEIEALGIEGVGVLPDSRRVYPQGQMASQLLGTVGIENNGLSGLEATAESRLGGTDGKRTIVKDARGDPIDLQTVEESTDGSDLSLTLDSALQARTEAALAKVGEKFKPTGATAVVMDPRTSDILALANWPGLESGDAEDATKEELLNRTSGFVYEPGSTFKAFTVAAALEENAVTPDTSFDLPSILKVADREIEEAHERGPVTLRVRDILAQSSNVGSVKIGLKLGARKLDRWIERFGFGRTTGASIPGEEVGIVPRYADYSGSTIGNLPIGQGLSVTPLQMLTAYAAIANGGTLRPARMLQSDPKSEGKRIISRRTARSLQKMLAGVLKPGGTAAEVQIPGYTLAGKTGTAEKVVDGAYSKSKYVASFVGFAPAKRPELLVAVVVDEPSGSIYGGDVAAPAFGEIASFALPHLGIDPR